MSHVFSPIWDPHLRVNKPLEIPCKCSLEGKVVLKNGSSYWPVNDVFPEFPSATLRACWTRITLCLVRMLKINRDHLARLDSSNREYFAYYQYNEKTILLYAGGFRAPEVRNPAGAIIFGEQKTLSGSKWNHSKAQFGLLKKFFWDTQVKQFANNLFEKKFYV